MDLETLNKIRVFFKDLMELERIESKKSANEPSARGMFFASGRASGFFQAAEMVNTLLTVDDKDNMSEEDKRELDRQESNFEERRENQ